MDLRLGEETQHQLYVNGKSFATVDTTPVRQANSDVQPQERKLVEEGEEQVLLEEGMFDKEESKEQK
jgi:hypothetical protein